MFTVERTTALLSSLRDKYKYKYFLHEKLLFLIPIIAVYLRFDIDIITVVCYFYMLLLLSKTLQLESTKSCGIFFL